YRRHLPVGGVDLAHARLARRAEEPGVVPVGQDAGGRGGGQVALQPLLHRGAPGAPAGGGAGAVEGDQVPGSDVEGVVALGTVTGGRAPVVEVGTGAFLDV